MIDEKTADLRLLLWFEDPEKGEGPIIFRRNRCDFGDKSAATALELCHSNHIVKECKMDLAKYLLSEIRYSDNIMGSVTDKDEMEKVIEDIKQAYQKFGFRLKYIHSAVQFDPDALLDEKRGSNPEEILLGMRYNLKTDTILPNVHFNIFGKKEERF